MVPYRFFVTLLWKKIVGRDNQPRNRQAFKLARKKACIDSYDRVLIVSEGSKTEPYYFNEIKNFYRLSTANIKVYKSNYGTDPLSVVNFARDLFESGNSHIGISPRSFEQVFAVFDRDDHQHDNYHEALDVCTRLDGSLRNDQKKIISFKAVASVPSFELWLLLHYQDINHSIHRNEVFSKLKYNLPEYEKGQRGHFEATRCNLDLATARAKALALLRDAHDDNGPYTDVHSLVDVLCDLCRP